MEAIHISATGNYIEAGLWAVIAVLILAFARKQRGRVWRRGAVGALVLLLFGLSDVVEAQTGAWWRPWWLAVWKGCCLLLMITLLLQHRADRGKPQL